MVRYLDSIFENGFLNTNQMVIYGGSPKMEYKQCLDVYKKRLASRVILTP